MQRDIACAVTAQHDTSPSQGRATVSSIVTSTFAYMAVAFGERCRGRLQTDFHIWTGAQHVGRHRMTNRWRAWGRFRFRFGRAPRYDPAISDEETNGVNGARLRKDSRSPPTHRTRVPEIGQQGVAHVLRERQAGGPPLFAMDAQPRSPNRSQGAASFRRRRRAIRVAPRRELAHIANAATAVAGRSRHDPFHCSGLA